MVIIDSLTDLIRSSGSDNMTWVDLISLLKGIQRMSKQWNAIIYALLTSEIFDTSKQEEVSDCADGVLVFKWDVTGANQLQRMMYIKKFRGLMPYLEEDNVVRFETKVSSSRAFEISNIREIMGR
jgi:archaellum biogenesis ATPase FlaH